MKERTLFECELCHTQYAAKIDAQCCESNHKKSIHVSGERFLSEKQDKSGYPIEVTLLMDDGEKIKYKRC